MKRTYKIGQILTLNEDMQVIRALSEEPEIIPKGSKVIVGADNLLHHLRDGSIQPMPPDTVVQGYDSKGLVQYIVTVLKAHLPIANMLEDYEYETEDLDNEIEYALTEIGLC